MKRHLLGMVLNMAMMSVFAQSPTASQTPVNTGDATTTAAASSTTCPDISVIIRNPTQGNWTAQTDAGFWKSYDMSFATNLGSFEGAQWVGANLGQITCIYSATQQFVMNGQQKIQPTLPILLVYHALSHQPQGGSWQTAGSGVLNCKSSSQGDCPFAINVQPKAGNIFEEAESFKTKPSKTPSPANAN